MVEVKILIEGCAEQLENGWRASSTTCLITTENKIITDPGCYREKLLELFCRFHRYIKKDGSLLPVALKTIL